MEVREDGWRNIFHSGCSISILNQESKRIILFMNTYIIYSFSSSTSTPSTTSLWYSTSTSTNSWYFFSIMNFFFFTCCCRLFRAYIRFLNRVVLTNSSSYGSSTNGSSRKVSSSSSSPLGISNFSLMSFSPVKERNMTPSVGDVGSSTTTSVDEVDDSLGKISNF